MSYYWKAKKRYIFSLINRDQICIINQSLGDFSRVSEKIKEKRSAEESNKVKKLENK